MREIPRTGALLDQKVQSLDPISGWLLDRLKAGTPTRKHERWPEWVTVDELVDDYVSTSERLGIRRKATATALGIKVRRLLPGIRHCRRSIEDGAAARRTWVYELPPLAECREGFAELFGQAIDWGGDDEDG